MHAPRAPTMAELCQVLGLSQGVRAWERRALAPRAALRDLRDRVPSAPFDVDFRSVYSLRVRGLRIYPRLQPMRSHFNAWHIPSSSVRTPESGPHIRAPTPVEAQTQYRHTTDERSAHRMTLDGRAPRAAGPRPRPARGRAGRAADVVVASVHSLKDEI